MLKSLLPCLQYACQLQPLLARLSVTTAATAVSSHYEVLGLPRSATAEDVKNAFRQKAKELHPDLNAAYTAADGEAFLRLVTAYEVLSDPEQRQLYDIASSSQLPDSLRQAAAAAAAAAGSANSSTASDAPETNTADPFGWRYGLSEWAKYGPGNGIPAIADGAGGFRLSLLHALARHRNDLEHDLHAGLLKAFLGPKLEVAPGQLPPAFEADERAHPSLSHDLLHLVHGRTLLGVVRIQQPLQLAGDEAATAALPCSVTQQLAASGATNSAAMPADACSTNHTCTAATDSQPTGSDPTMAPQQQQQPAAGPNTVAGPATLAAAATTTDILSANAGALAAAVATIVASPANSKAADVAAGAAAAPDPYHPAEASDKRKAGQQLTAATTSADVETEIGELEWQELLQKQHPLHGNFDWMPPPPLQLPAATQQAAPTSPGNVDSVQHACFQQAGDEGMAGDSSGGCDGGWKAAVWGAADADALHDHFTLGGQAMKQAWEDTWQQQHGCNAGVSYQSLVGSNKPLQPATSSATGTAVPNSAGPVAEAAATASDIDTTTSSSGKNSGLRHPPNQSAAAVKHCSIVDPLFSVTEHSRASESGPQQAEREATRWQQHLKQQGQWMATEPSGDPQPSQHSHNGSQDEQPMQQRRRQRQERYQPQARWLRQRRLWRWVRCPTPDWSAADWEFDDSSEAVLVLQLLMDGGRVAAVAVRDDKQPAKPTKVYINGTFTVAILDDIVMEPLTGRLMGVLYKYYTPGVHHLYFYLPGTQGSRVLARLQRRWMPPSSTWLFPPVSESHDRGGWVVEWEGHGAETNPGWMHPAVFMLTAASYSYDIEARKLHGSSRSERQQQLWQHASDLGRRLAQVQRWLQVKMGGQT